ncbi:TonB-dependent receptor domain-containing protein [Qipengyuania sp.]|uniref:TonB-dependent receptor domain-containing protein n=1 Tax=Qipengyuania sp. TaxID=2004515 RepID=UPI003BA92DD0
MTYVKSAAMAGRARLFAGAGIAALAMSAVGAPLAAQEQDEDVAVDTEATATQDTGNVIMVTGSRIQRPELEGAAPLIAAVGEDELEERAFTNISDALNEVPGFGTPVSSAGAQSGFSVGQNFVNLFGIGSQRTLTLVNGRRFVSSNTASNFSGANAGLQVDLNVLPISLVERIDVLAVEGAATYGSDAVAGTVNVILKDDFEGLEVTGQYGIFEEGDGESLNGSVTVGGNIGDGRGNIAVNFEYDRQNGVRTLDRALGRERLFRDNENLLIEDDTIFVISPNGLPTRGPGLFNGGYVTSLFGLPPGGFTNAAGDFVAFDRSGNLVPYDLGDLSGGNLVRGSGGDGLDLARAGQILSDVERYTLFALGHYDITDNIRFFFEANYAHTEAVELTNQPVYQSALFSGDSLGLGFLLSNPFLSDQNRAILSRPGNLDSDGDGVADLNFDTDGDGVDDDTQFFLQRAGFDLLGGSNPNFQQLELFRIVGGLQGDFQVLEDRDWFWNVSYAFGRSQAVSSSTALVQRNFLNAVDAVRDPTTGEIVCRVTIDPPPPLGTGFGTPEATKSVTDCVPLNLFGEGVASPEAIDFVTAETLAESRNTQNIFNANLGGGLFDIWGGNEIAFNIGYEYRKEEQTFNPDGFLQEGLGRSVAISPVAGSFNTNEFFGELLVPLITPANDFFIHSFEIDGSFRYIDNSQAGSAEVFSIGGQLAPIPSVTFRGSYTESVRAPAITELFLPAVDIFSFADDPCDPDFIDAGAQPATRRANCDADGRPAGFDSQIDDASQLIQESGNPNLLNEESKAWTAGVVLEPAFVPGLAITVDWVDIELTNAIVTLDLTDVLRSCYDNPNFPNVPTCNQFQRDPTTFQITGAQVGQSNAGLFEFAGLSASARYGFDLMDVFGGDSDIGRLDLLARYFYLDKSQFTVVGVLDDDKGEIGDFEHEFNGTVRYSNGSFGISLTGNYLSGASFDLEEDQTAPFATVGDYIVFDSTISYDIDDNFRLALTVNNLFEEEPPFPSRSTTQYTDGMLGREFLLRVTTRY